MKKLFSLTLVLALSLCLLAGCGGQSEPAAETEAPVSSAAHEFDFDGNAVRVEVDLKDGWCVEFGENATYLYDGPMTDDSEAVAYGVYVDPQEYEDIIAEYSSYDSFQEVGGGVMFTESDGMNKYVFVVGDNTNYMIMVEAGNDADAVYNRFHVNMA